MAIDTAQERSSIVGLGDPWGIPGWPGSGIDAADRAQAASLYAGYSYAAVVDVPFIYRRSSAFAEPSIGIEIARAGYDGFPLYMPIEDITQLQFQTDLSAGGYGLGNVGMADDEAGQIFAYLPAPMDVEYLGIMRILIGSAQAHRGLITNLVQPQGETVGIESRGTLGHAGLFRPWLPGAGAMSRLPARSIIREAVRNHNGYDGEKFRVANNEVIHRLTTSHYLSEFHSMPLWRILQQIAAEGDGEYGAFAVGYGNNLITLGSYREPTGQAHYTVSVEDIVIDVDAQNVVNEMIVSYTNLHGEQREVRVVDLLSAKRTRHSIAEYVPSELKTAGAAYAFGRSYLRDRRTPIRSATITRHWSQPLRTGIGEPKRIYLARAGEWVEIYGIGKLPIVRTDYDHMTGIGTVQLGAMNTRTAAFLLAQAKRSNTALSKGLNVNTGARAA